MQDSQTGFRLFDAHRVVGIQQEGVETHLGQTGPCNRQVFTVEDEIVNMYLMVRIPLMQHCFDGRSY